MPQGGLYTSAGTAHEYVIEFVGRSAMLRRSTLECRSRRQMAYRRWLDPACAITGEPSQRMSEDDMMHDRASAVGRE
jgi:hypothetical protein